VAYTFRVECVNPMVIGDDGPARHLSELGEIAYDQDTGHVAFDDNGYDVL
jgi:hypothetical protein